MSGPQAGKGGGEARARGEVEVFAAEAEEGHGDFEAYLIDEMARAEAAGHFWFTARLAWIEALFRRWVPAGASTLDIGAGTGRVAARLCELGYRVAVGDIHRSGLERARQAGVETRYLMNIYEPPFDDAFDVVSLFDVVEHLEEDRRAVENVYRMVAPGGLTVLTAPAHAWLWNRHDELSGHKRRYTRATLSALVEGAGFEVLHSAYFFKFLLPLLVLRRLLGEHHEAADEVPRDGIFSIHPLLNRALGVLCSMERGVAPLLPEWGGGSVVVVGRKPPA
ncbi:class I SAM-dependent methyltransferase [Endothiovibrio diazotrophicus]